MRIIKFVVCVVAVAATACTSTRPPATVISMTAACEAAVAIGLPVDERGTILDSRAQIRIHVLSAAGGAPVTNARVALTTGTEEVVAATTDARGEGLILAPAGEYHLEVRSLGFRTTRSELRLQGGRDYIAYVPIWIQPIC